MIVPFAVLLMGVLLIYEAAMSFTIKRWRMTENQEALHGLYMLIGIIMILFGAAGILTGAKL